MIEEIIIYGTISSGIYALLALGFTLIYGIAGIVNLAHGSFYMLGAYMFFVMEPISITLFQLLFGTSTLLGLELLLASVVALILSVIFVAAIASISYRLTIHPVLGNQIGVMVVTVCLALIFQQITMLVFGVEFKPVRWPLGSFLMESVPGGVLGVSVQWSRILALGVSLILFVAVMAIVAYTKIGKAMRAVSQDREVAMIMGINTERLYMLTMALSASFAAAASILITTSTTMSAGAWMWLHPLALSFAIVILGGLGSIKGSFVGGFIIGYAEQAVAIAVPESGAILGVVPLSVMVLVLLLRPKGLFGKRVEMEE